MASLVSQKVQRINDLRNTYSQLPIKTKLQRQSKESLKKKILHLLEDLLLYTGNGQYVKVRFSSTITNKIYEAVYTNLTREDVKLMLEVKGQIQNEDFIILEMEVVQAYIKEIIL